MKNTAGALALIVVTVIWGGGFVASDIALETMTPFQIMSARFLIAAVLMGALAGRNIFRITKAEWLRGIALGSALFAGFALQIVGLQYTTASKNAFLTATNVVMVPFITWLVCRRKIERQSVIGAMLAIVGAGLLSLRSDFTIGAGDLLTLGCAVGFALQIFLTGRFVGAIRPQVLNFMQMVTACILSLLGLLFTKMAGLAGDAVFLPSRRSLVAVLYLAVVSTTLCYLLQTLAQRYVDETKSAIILSMEAVFGTVFSVLLLGEPVTVRMIAGSAVIFAAVLVAEIGQVGCGVKNTEQGSSISKELQNCD